MSVHEQYFGWVQEYRSIYGPKTMVMAEMGSFMEMMHAEEDPGVLRTVCEILNLILTRRNKPAGSQETACVSNPWLAGFPSASLERYARQLVDRGYTVVVATQIPIGKGKYTRKVTEVLSPSTYISEMAEQWSSREPCVVAMMWKKEPTKRTLDGFLWTVSLVSVSTFTGAIWWSNSFSTWFDPHKARDDAAAFVQAFAPAEVLVGGDVSKDEWLATWAGWLGIDPQTTPVHTLGNTAFATEEARGALWEAVYQEEYGRRAGGGGARQFERSLGCWGDESVPVTLAATLRFLWNHHEALVRRIPLPTAWGAMAEEPLRETRTLQLESNTFYQLQLDAVFEMVGRGMGPLGKRALRQRLLLPSVSTAEVNRLYDQVDHWRGRTCTVRESMRATVAETGDWERIHRKMTLRKAMPGDLLRLLRGLRGVEPLEPELPSVPTWLPAYRQYWEEKVVFEALPNVGLPTSPLLFPEVHWSPELTDTWYEIHWTLPWIEAIEDCLRGELDEGTWLRVEENERDGRYLSITKKRWGTRKPSANNGNTSTVDVLPAGMKDDPHGRRVHEHWAKQPIYTAGDALQWQAVPQGTQTASVRITCPFVAALDNRRRQLQSRLEQLLLEHWTTLLEETEARWGDRWIEMHRWWAGEDVALEAARLADEYQYARPVLLEEGNSSICVEGLRHILLERRATKEAYVPNDVELGCDEGPSSVLLYGVNACGKSSLGRALGLTVVLAQAGLYVPATSCRLRPFTRILCRILGNDDPMKGLSSFAVEMEEIRAILSRADAQTLVLMDEPCRGTEADSAQALMAACIYALHECQARTWVATHLHGLAQLPEVVGRKNVRCFHLAVTRDAQGRLVYERVLRPGPGPSTYGIEVARAMGLPEDVLTMAEQIRRREEHIGSDPRGRASRYHASVWMSECKICGRPAEHTHHVLEQHTADERGFVANGVHKHHPSNLVPLCEDCHERIHRGDITVTGYKHTSSGVELQYTSNVD